jgi:hypothetical protein
MTTIARTADARPAAPVWMTWAPRLALGWAVAYGGLRVWFATGHEPEWKLPSDLLISSWAPVAACLISVAAIVSVESWPRSRAAIVATWATAAGWVAVCAFALLDFVGGILPGLGIPFDLAGMLSRVGGLTGAVLLGATALARQRRLDPSCLSCTGRMRSLTFMPYWAIAGAWLAVVGCLTRLAAQAVVGLNVVPYDGGLSVLLFEGGFLLAGVVLPLLLVHRLGKVFPRWMLLLPGAGLGAGITAYFGAGLIQMIVATLKGGPVYGDTTLPDSFFWVAVPAYLCWGVGLAVATYGYYLRTRKPCKACGR